MNTHRAGPGLLAVAGAVGAAVGAIGTWAKIEDLSYTGWDANRGKTVLIAGVIAGVLALLNLATRQRVFALLGLIAAGVSAALAAWTIIDIAGYVPGAPSVGRGWGIYVATAGGVVCFVALLALVFWRRERSAAPAAPPAQ